MLELEDAVPYLLERGAISPLSIVDGALRVVDRSRLNRVFVVTVDGQPRLVLKLSTGADEGAAREAAVLERLIAYQDDGALAALLPRVVLYDPEERALLLEAIPGAQDLHQRHQRGRFSVVLAREAGRALGLLHAMPTVALGGLPRLPGGDWRLSVHRPDMAAMRSMSEAATELTAIVQQWQDFCDWLDELRAATRDTAVVHGDVRWDNFLAFRSAGTSRWNRLMLIDWETGDPGDPAADIGAFYGEYLAAWLRSMPPTVPRDPARARLPLGRMQPALRGFWDAYVTHRKRSPAELSPTLRRATQFAAVRLLSAALEEAQALAALNATVIDMLQLSRAVLRRPDEAAGQLLGLQAAWGRS